MFFKIIRLFLKNIGLIEKNIRLFVDKDTVDWLQTPIVCKQPTVCYGRQIPVSMHLGNYVKFYGKQNKKWL